MDQIEILGLDIDKLTEKERIAITLFYYEGFNHKEISEAMGLTEPLVSLIISKATLRLSDS